MPTSFKNKINLSSVKIEKESFITVRKVSYEVTIANDKANITIAIVEQIGKIYRVEADIRRLESDKRLEERQNKSKILVERLFTGFRKAYDQLQKKAIQQKLFLML